MIRLALLACASALMAVATIAYALHERRHWAEMSVDDYVALLEGDDAVQPWDMPTGFTRTGPGNVWTWRPSPAPHDEAPE